MRTERRFASSLRAHLLWVTTGFTAALLTVGAAAAFLPLFWRFDAGALSDRELERLTGEILDLHAQLWPVVATSLLSTAVCTWWLHGRMRGPLFRFVAAFRSIAAGDAPAPVVIRATDYVKEESAELNAMIVALRERDAARATAIARVEERAASLSNWAATSGDAEAIRLAQELEESCKALRHEPK